MTPMPPGPSSPWTPPAGPATHPPELVPILARDLPIVPFSAREARVARLRRRIPGRLRLAAIPIIAEVRWRLSARRRAQGRARAEAALRGTPHGRDSARYARRHERLRRAGPEVLGSPDPLALVRERGREHFTSAVGSDRGVIVTFLHSPMLLVGAMACALPDRRQYLSAEGGIRPPMKHFYRTLAPELERLGSRWVPVSGSYGVLREALATGQVCRLAFDVPGGHQVTFRGRTALFRSGIASLSRETGALIVPQLWSFERGTVVANYGAPIDPREHERPIDVLQAVADAIDSLLLQHPEAYVAWTPRIWPEDGDRYEWAFEK